MTTHPTPTHPATAAVCVDCQRPYLGHGPACRDCQALALEILRRGAPVGLCS